MSDQTSLPIKVKPTGGKANSCDWCGEVAIGSRPIMRRIKTGVVSTERYVYYCPIHRRVAVEATGVPLNG